MAKRVYLSSTYKDLERHRSAVARMLRGVYDVEWMEDYPAADERPRDKCLKDVEACDYFILILGLRYGYEPPLDNPKGKSITHLEYDHAIHHEKPCFVFLLNPEYKQKPKWVDPRARKPTSRIGALRSTVEQKHLRVLFTTPESLATEVLRALNLHEQKHPDRTPAFSWPRPWDFTAFMEERRAGFHGRGWLFEEIRDWMGATHPRALLIRADFGVGKSAFLSELVRRNPENRIVAWHFCQHDTEETLKPATFVRSLAARLATALPDYRRIVESDPGMQERLALSDASSVFEAVILNPLRQVPRPASHRLLVVDALDEALELAREPARKIDTILSLLSAKASRLPDWLRVLATSRSNPNVVGGLRAAFGLREIDAEDTRNRDDLDGYVSARCASPPISDKLGATSRSPAAVAALLRDRSQGKFLYAVRALTDLANGTISVEELTELPPGMDAFYAKAFERHFGDSGPGYTPFKELLGALVAAREPLPSSTLAAILERREDDIKAQRGRLSDFITVRQERYALDHFSLAEWLTKEDNEGARRAGVWAVDLPATNERMRRWAIGRVEAGEAHLEPYLVRHLDSHLAAHERDRILPPLLFDARWLYARLRAVGVAALIDDCASVQQSESARLLRMALRNSAHLVATGPHLLPGQIVGRLGGQDLPELLELCRAFRDTSGEWGPVLLPVNASLPLSATLVATLTGEHHVNLVTAIVALPEGRLAVGAKHGPVRIWAPGRGSDPSIAQGYRYGVTSLVALPGGGLAAGTERGLVYVWERPGDGEALLLAAHKWSRDIEQLILLRDGRLASASGDRTVIWDPAARAEPIVLRDGEYGVKTLVELPDGRLASGSNEGLIRVWNPEGGVLPLVLKGHQDLVLSLVALPDGRLVSAGSDKTIRVWDCTGGVQLFAVEGHEGHVTALAVLPDGRLASGSSDGRIRVWVPSRDSTPTILERHDAMIRVIVSLPDGRLASGADDRTVRLWDPDGAGHLVVHEHESLITTLAVLPDGRLASGCGDGSVHVLDLERPTALAPAAQGGIRVTSLAVLPDGRIVSGAVDRTIRVRDLATGEETILWRDRERTVDSLQVLPQGGLACATSHEAIVFRDLADRSCARVLRTSENVIGAVAVFPDGRIASGALDNTVRVRDPRRTGKGRILSGHTDWIWRLAVLPDGRLASGACDGTIRVWNLERGGGDPRVLSDDSSICSLAVLPDGRLASGSSHGTVRVWNLAGDQDPVVLLGHEDLVSGLAVFPGGRLASSSGDGTVRLWDLDARREIARFHADARIDALAATADGLVLASDSMGRLHSLRLRE